MLRLIAITALLFPLTALNAAELSFNKDIRPILSDKCFACHGMDAKHRKADLRLDEFGPATAKNKDGETAILPGKPAESLVWQRIITTDPDDVMPPSDSHKQLSAAEKEIIRQWIEQGAGYQKHWAFEAPQAPAIPSGPGSEIDRFIAAGMQDKGWKIAPEANRETLIRRVSFALTGLTPSLAEVDQFLADKAEGAYERMVDRYLESPRFGEEMARHWLDIARYADTHGLHLDNERQTWAYRDWVINAFNRNLTFDKFTQEQLAGDLIPNATPDQIVATGFNRCNATTSEGGSIAAEFIFRYAVERASTTAQTWLGLTAGCAVCHDHKYDPITAKDFYSFYAFFHSNADPAMDGNALLTSPVMKLKPEGYDAKMAAFNQRLTDVQKRLEAKAAAVTYQDPAEITPAPPVREVEHVWFDDSFPPGAQVAASGHPTTFVETPVHSGKRSLKRGGEGTAQDYYSAGATPLEVPAGGKIFLHVYLDPADPADAVMIQFHSTGWSHRAFWGQDIIPFGAANTPERVAAGTLPPPGQWGRLEVDASKLGLSAGAKLPGYAFTVQGGTAYFDKMGIVGRSDPAADPLLSFKAWRQDRAGKDTPGATPEINRWIKEGPAKERKPNELKALRDFYVQTVCATTRAEFTELVGEEAAARQERDGYDGMVPSTFVFNDLPTPRESFVMIRGQYDKPGDKVEPATPAVLPALKKAKPDARANRLDLANWLVARENPLTARVTVNRFWQQLFGVGLVKTSEDFGTMGELPSHPELLDWLSIWFQDNGWDVKKLVRLMVTSGTFRQQGEATPEIWARDPENRLLARGPRFRLEAEQIRDQALFASGLINLRMGGKGDRIYQPPNIWEPVGFAGSNTRNYTQDKGDALYRRTIYTFFKRTAPHPMLVNFDAPNREQTCSRRERSNTPLQALQLMNDVQYVEASRGLAQRMMSSGGATPQERLKYGFRSVLSRAPNPTESSAILGLYERQLAKYKAAPEEAKKAVTVGESKLAEGLNEQELAAWTLVANLIFNLDEAIVRN